LERLYAEPQRFELFQAVRLLFAEAVEGASTAGTKAPPLIGSRVSGVALRTPIRFHSSPTLGFPQGAITAIRRDPPSEAAGQPDSLGRVHIDLACFGMIGPAGTLPRHYSSLVVERYRRFRDSTLREFLDIFEQRMAATLYNAWAKYRPAVQQQLTAFTGEGVWWDEAAETPRDPVTATVASLVGLGGKGLPHRLAASDDVVLRHAAHFSRQPRSAESLERLLRDVYRVPVRVEQFVGRWLELEQPDQTALASRDRPEGLNARLGIDAIAGRRVWDVESTFEVAVGPLSAADFRSRLPGTERLAALGVNLSVGTDSLASTDSLSLLGELRRVQESQPGLAADALLRTVTVAPARALGQEGRLGCIARDALADLIAIPYCGTPDGAAAACVAHAGRVPWMMLDGKVMASPNW
jgi:type VI secretion system protein ImpH